MVDSHAAMLVPGLNESILAMARSSASWTRSSAASARRHNALANARNCGMALIIASCTAGSMRTAVLPDALCGMRAPFIRASIGAAIACRGSIGGSLTEFEFCPYGQYRAPPGCAKLARDDALKGLGASVRYGGSARSHD